MTYDVIHHTRKLQELLDSQTPFATITLLHIRGSAPQVAGAKAIVTANGIEAGTIGGGKIEGAAIQHAQMLLSSEDGIRCELVTWNLQTDIQMTCGGEVNLFFEIHNEIDWPIAIFGAGHIAQSLVPLLVQLHCHITCLDTRPEWLDRLPPHPKLVKRYTHSLRDEVAQQPAGTFFVLMTKGHATDLPVLAEILTTRDAPYVGVIGSLQKASVLRRELASQKISPEKINRFFCPMGLPLGNNTPAEIAISVVAQLIQQRDRLGILKHKVKDF
jgi:xanthine dehydrogenase accessory factor